MQKCKKCKGVFLSHPKFECPVKHCFFIAVPAITGIAGTPLRHLYGGAVPSVLRRHGNYAIRKFLSSLGNFPSRIPFRYAENIPTEPKGATPWRTPEPMSAEPSLLGLCRVQPGEDHRSTPERLLRKPCAPIVPQHNHACP